MVKLVLKNKKTGNAAYLPADAYFKAKEGCIEISKIGKESVQNIAKRIGGKLNCVNEGIFLHYEIELSENITMYRR